MFFSILTFFTVSHHIPGPTVFNSLFSCFSVCLAIFHVIECLCLILHVFQILAIIQDQQCVFLIFFYVFHCFFHISCPTLCVSHFAVFSVFLAIFQVLQCEFLNFLLVSFLCIFTFLPCAFLIFHVFQCFLTYSRSCSVCVSFSTFFCFLAILQILLCAFLIFHVFHCFLPYSR